MKLSEYQLACLRTWAPAPDQRDRVLNACLGLAGEVGEVLEPLKKHYYHGRSLDVADLELEIGDVLYYIAVLASEFGLDLDTTLQLNIDKLKKRYP